MGQVKAKADLTGQTDFTDFFVCGHGEKSGGQRESSKVKGGRGGFDHRARG